MSTNHYYIYVFENIFLPIFVLAIGFLKKLFNRVEIFNFIKTKLLNFSYRSAFGVVLKTHHQAKVHVDFLFSKILSVL